MLPPRFLEWHVVPASKQVGKLPRKKGSSRLLVIMKLTVAV